MEDSVLWLVETITVLLPIAGALIAGISLLAHSVALKEERRIRVRIASRIDEMYPFPSPNPILQRENSTRLKRLLLEYNGLLQPGRTNRDVQIDMEMSDAPLSGYQVSNQYILLIAALLSLALWPVREAMRAQAGIYF